MTYGIIYFVLCELIGLGIPIILLALCGTFSVGRLAVSQSAMISISVYPICGPYYVLMSNKDYNEKVNLILKRIKKMTTSLRPHPPAQDQTRTTPTF
ncbi:unnamed protein product [Auanema sp. JU1783]|nr:unnamed protein product [Auanema sp. JU1783]